MHVCSESVSPAAQLGPELTFFMDKDDLELLLQVLESEEFPTLLPRFIHFLQWLSPLYSELHQLGSYLN